MEFNDLPVHLLLFILGYKNVIHLLSTCKTLQNTKGLRIGLEGKIVHDFALWPFFNSSLYQFRGLHLFLHQPLSPLVHRPWVHGLTIVGQTKLDVLRGHQTLVELVLKECDNVSMIEDCPRLETLHMHMCDGLVGLGKFPALRKLELLRCKDLQKLHHCGKLTELSLIQCPAVEQIPVCPALTDLALSGCKRLNHIRPLAVCGALTELRLNGCKHLLDLTPLVHCGALTQIDLAGCTNITDLSPLLACKLLKILILTRCKSLEDISPVTNCCALSYVDLRGCPLSTWGQAMSYASSCRSYELEELTKVHANPCTCTNELGMIE